MLKAKFAKKAMEVEEKISFTMQRTFLMFGLEFEQIAAKIFFFGKSAVVNGLKCKTSPPQKTTDKGRKDI